MLILGIETSCDETGVALYDSDKGLVGHSLYSQVKMHADYGGVVPELASRDHVRKLLPMVNELLQTHNLEKTALDGIAYTAGPGLIGALLVGAAFGRALAYGLNIPAIGVHHMEAHLLAPMLEENPPPYPFIALLVSGGHTQIVKVETWRSYQLLGESLDDAAGEAFDKTAKLLDLDYPGGPRLAALAEQGHSGRFHFPRPMVDRPGLDMSFSGLKTAALRAIRENTLDEQTKADIACAFQEAVVETLVIKCKRALIQTGLSRLVVAGGVSANKLLRTKLTDLLKELNGEAYYPRHEFCTDNGAMVAYTGALYLQAGFKEDLYIKAHPRWNLMHKTS